MNMPNVGYEVSMKLSAIGTEMKARAVRASFAMKNAELKVLRGKRSGRRYKKPHMKTHYTASAPGEPPAVRTGALRESFRPVSQEENSRGNGLSVNVSIATDKNYARALDVGTERIKPRPYTERVKQEAMPEVSRIFGQPFDI